MPPFFVALDTFLAKHVLLDLSNFIYYASLAINMK